MQLGIFAKTFPRGSVEEVFAAVTANGLAAVQFNMACAGLPTLPEAIDIGLPERIRSSAARNGIAIPALSATFNLIHPDPATVDDGLTRLAILAPAARAMGASILTLCTGTRDAADMWRAHPDNTDPLAWRELRSVLARALAITSEYDLTLAIEPEPGNVVRDAQAARRLLDEVSDPRLGIIIDPANLLAGDLSRPPVNLLRDAVNLLGSDIVLAHAKDITATGKPCAPGQGIVPWAAFIDLLQTAGCNGPLILHGFDETEVAGAIATVAAALR